MDTSIKTIHKETAWELRHVVMWPEKEMDFIKLADDDAGIHFGLYVGERVVSVLSLFIEKEEAQFRKFATFLEEQGKGYGSQLLKHVIAEAEKRGVKRIWCNARSDKADFYKKFGLVETDSTFEKAGKTYVIMEKFL